ncbi:PH domain-containing protein [[Limnothrix rosea] IAM M-220]|uniref:PH domain-containing protein n=1 Tax=[Limnothrix rosea] IAM M-220 TaxID=454133 RepID=UPI000966D83D|nr:PH domain-containing protein [[Limnothrix rosea] IAM M-220]OKH16973.1 hypothetical protein NIES208_11380 [[Limnothrix rosea] IAM M-220]
MDQPLFFKAPWGAAVMVITVSTCILMIAVSMMLAWIGDRQNFVLLYLVALIPVLIVLITSFYSVRGYLVTNNRLQVARLGWFTTIPLNNLETVVYEPKAMAKSLRLFGDGGLFAFTGRFRNQALGNYRAYVTHLNKTVVLIFTDKTVVVSPQRPEEFVRMVTRAVAKQL